MNETADVPTIVQAALAILNIIVALLGFGFVIWNIFWVIPQQRETQRMIDQKAAQIDVYIERMK